MVCSVTILSFFRYAWRCESCGFDLCYGCTKDYKSFMHEHILTKSDPKKTFPALISWKCQLCKKHYSHTDVEKPYICRECKPPFRICGTCLTGKVLSPELDEVNFCVSTHLLKEELKSEKWNRKSIQRNSYLQSFKKGYFLVVHFFPYMNIFVTKCSKWLFHEIIYSC